MANAVRVRDLIEAILSIRMQCGALSTGICHLGRPDHSVIFHRILSRCGKYL